MIKLFTHFSFLQWPILPFFIEAIRNIKNPFEEVGKWILRLGSDLPGLRLMYASASGFPLEELTIWDTILGSLFYCLNFICLLWLATPLPDIQVHFFLIASFEERTRGPHEREPPVFNIIDMPQGVWHPAGGEGPVLNPPPPPPP
ncbi:hypothetical protein AVEN_100915-1 [Araneus ventricosus]|uniref:Uncharacterized protein n=1 Tax=Araneus ventricosus TaxID=182803 RepID=A0A4Y2AYX5_ARAVE|nr:hypothetical protein AVEN_100915-1 [Araneus ventricosus]